VAFCGRSAFAYSCGAVADFHRLPVHSAARSVDCRPELRATRPAAGPPGSVRNTGKSKRSEPGPLGAFRSPAFPRSPKRAGGSWPVSWLMLFRAGLPSHPAPRDSGSFGQPNAITVAGPRWFRTRLPSSPNVPVRQTTPRTHPSSSSFFSVSRCAYRGERKFSFAAGRASEDDKERLRFMRMGPRELPWRRPADSDAA